VIYLMFNEGYSATAGDDWMRPALCEEALRLGRILAELMPTEPEVHGLVALMEIQAFRELGVTPPRATRDRELGVTPSSYRARFQSALYENPTPRRRRARRQQTV
jgi:predicted RNA polymerase sigma factor